MDEKQRTEINEAAETEAAGNVLREFYFSLTRDLGELKKDIIKFEKGGKSRFPERGDVFMSWFESHDSVHSAKLDEVIALAAKVITQEKPSERMVRKELRTAIAESVAFLKQNAKNKQVTEVKINAKLCSGSQQMISNKAAQLLERSSNPSTVKPKTRGAKKDEATLFKEEMEAFQLKVLGQEKAVVLGKILTQLVPDLTKTVSNRYSRNNDGNKLDAEKVAQFYVLYALFTEYFKSMKLLYQVLLKEYEELELLSEEEIEKIRLSAITQISTSFAQGLWKGKDGSEKRAKFRKEMLSQIRTAVHQCRTKDGSRQSIAALCLSGGGIRSATFGLGVLQALAKYGLLDKFDYLSTVSGGGYIGGWLSAWISRKSQEGGVTHVQKQMNEPSDGEVEPPEVTHLRAYSNYMSPRLGLGSADTWALIGVYLRNLLLNWTVVIPLAAAVCLLPRILSEIVHHAGDWISDGVSVAATALMSVSVICGIVAAFASTVFRPSINKFLPEDSWFSQTYRRDEIGILRSVEPRIVLTCAITMALFAAGATTYWSWGLNGERLTMLRQLMDFIRENRLFDVINYTIIGFFVIVFVFDLIYRREDRSELIWDRFSSFIVFAVCLVSIRLQASWFETNSILFGIVSWAALIFLAGFIPARLYVLWKSKRENKVEALEGITSEFSISYLAATLGGILLFAGSRAILAIRTGWTTGNEGAGSASESFADLYTVLAVPIFLSIYLLSGTLFVGIGSKLLDDADREWLSRVGAWLLMISVGWILLFGIVLSSEYVINELSEPIPVAKSLVASLGGITGVITLFFGFFAKSSSEEKPNAQRKGSWVISLLPIIAAPVFMVCLVIVIVWGSQQLMDLVGASIPWLNVYDHQGGRSALALIYWFLGFLAVGLVMGFWININKFSLHAIYRDRIIRAYLGASRGMDRLKTANSFTGLDERDNLAMMELTSQRPFHVVNMTLNLSKNTNLRWQNRKAESFTATAYHCGSSNMGEGSGNYRTSKLYGADKFGRPISLGTAIAVSGAAASPNMGYFTQSAPVSALMALFNIRLGWWLGNPGSRGRLSYWKNAPDFAPIPMLNELSGSTGDTNSYVYLSDGGHFENLGLYEMVLRRCKFIVLCDAAADGDYSYSDLASAIHKIRVDMGVSITFEDDEAPTKDRYCAIARIAYSEIDKGESTDGTLIYLKPTLTGSEPIDIANYKKRSPKFPHESTADQMYSESQFESYRLLGFHMMDTICTAGIADGDENRNKLSRMKENARKYFSGLSGSSVSRMDSLD